MRVSPMVSVSAATYAAIAREAERRGVHAAVVVAAALAGQWPADAVERTRAATAAAMLAARVAGGRADHRPQKLRALDVPVSLHARVESLVAGTHLWRRAVWERAIHAALDAEGART